MKLFHSLLAISFPRFEANLTPKFDRVLLMSLTPSVASDSVAPLSVPFCASLDFSVLVVVDFCWGFLVLYGKRDSVSSCNYEGSC